MNKLLLFCFKFCFIDDESCCPFCGLDNNTSFYGVCSFNLQYTGKVADKISLEEAVVLSGI